MPPEGSVEDSSPCTSSTTVETKVNTTMAAECGTIRLMATTRSRKEESVQLKRFRTVILQLERFGHPEWGLSKVGPSELARRTGLTTSYLDAIKHADRGGNKDVGGAVLAKMCDGMGLDIRYFFEKFSEERPFTLYLLSAKRDERRIDSFAKELREMRAEFANVRAEFAERDAKKERQIAVLEAELAEARNAGRQPLRGPKR